MFSIFARSLSNNFLFSQHYMDIDKVVISTLYTGHNSAHTWMSLSIIRFKDVTLTLLVSLVFCFHTNYKPGWGGGGGEGVNFEI